MMFPSEKVPSVNDRINQRKRQPKKTPDITNVFLKRCQEATAEINARIPKSQQPNIEGETLFFEAIQQYLAKGGTVTKIAPRWVTGPIGRNDDGEQLDYLELANTPH
jgi:hypothetical protein